MLCQSFFPDLSAPLLCRSYSHNLNDPVHVIGHDHKALHINSSKMKRNRGPAFTSVVLHKQMTHRLIYVIRAHVHCPRTLSTATPGTGSPATDRANHHALCR